MSKVDDIITVGEIGRHTSYVARKIRNLVREEIAKSVIERWGDPATLAERLMNNVVGFEEDPPEPNGRSWDLASYAWLISNLATFRVDDDRVCESVGDAAIETFMEGGVAPAYRCFMIELRRPVLCAWEGVEGYYFFLDHPDREQCEAALLTHFLVMANTDSLAMVPFGIFAGTDNKYIVPGHQITMPSRQYVPTKELPEKELENLRYIMDCSNETLAKNASYVCRLCISVAFLISSKLTNKRRVTAQSRHQKKRRRSSGKWVVPDVWELDIPVTLIGQKPDDGGDDRKRRAPGGPSARSQHVVAGHWRDQACGPRHTLRKRTWVPPHWRCKDSKHRKSTVVSTEAGE